MTAVALSAVRSRPEGVTLSLIMLLALGIRIALFNGAFGSDDNVYYERALDVARGEWSSANYNGALRYGFNIPAGLLSAVFGTSLMAVNMWPLLCSLAEILAVYWFAAALGGKRMAITAAVLLSCAPLHVSVATRIHADPVVAAFLTFGVVLTYFGWRDRRAGLLFVGGLSLGGVFWAKELAAVTYFGLLPLLWFFRGRWREAAIVIGGLVLMLLGHGLLMIAIAGHPLHLVSTVLTSLQLNFIKAGAGEDAALYYLRYLVFDIRHTGLLGWLGLAGVLGLALTLSRPALPNRSVADESRSAAAFLLVWLLGLLLILSVFPVSLSPLRFTMKQSNYISLFLAPLVISAAYCLSRMSGRSSRITVLAACSIGLALAALQQADYRAFTANGKAAALWAERHSEALLLGSKSNANVAALWLRAQRGGAVLAPVATLANWPLAGSVLPAPVTGGRELYVMYEPLTMSWPNTRPPVRGPLACWDPVLKITPVDLGLGNRFATAIARVLSVARVGPADRAAAILARLGQPDPVQVFRIDGGDPWCGARTLPG